MDFEESSTHGFVRCSNQGSIGGIRGDDRHQGDETCICQKQRNYAHAANILGTVRG